MPALAGAIRAYCAGQLFDRARQLAGTNPTFSTYIEEQYNNHLLQNKQADELAGRGGAMAQQAIDMYLQRDDWDKVRRPLCCFCHFVCFDPQKANLSVAALRCSAPRTADSPKLKRYIRLGSNLCLFGDPGRTLCSPQVHELAARQSPEVAAAYAARHAERRFKQGDYGAAAAVFAAHGISAATPQYFELYRSVASGILQVRAAGGMIVGVEGAHGLAQVLRVLLRVARALALVCRRRRARGAWTPSWRSRA